MNVMIDNIFDDVFVNEINAEAVIRYSRGELNILRAGNVT